MVAGVYFMLALIILLLPSRHTEAIARVVRGTILRPILTMQQGAVERHVLFDDPTRLRAQRDSLAAFLVGQATLAAENRRLRDLLGIGERLPPSFTPAEVVRIPGRGNEGTFQLTAGSTQGVVTGATVVSADGLVGQVREVDHSIAFGIDWMHTDFRASAMTIDGEVYGILEPRRTGGEPLLLLTGTPRHVDLEPGALIVTYGVGGIYPRGVPIGTVVGEEEGEASWQKNYLVRPLVAPTEMNYVLVLGPPQETSEGVNLATSWGIRPGEAPSQPAEAPAQPVGAPSQPAGPPSEPAGTPSQGNVAPLQPIGVPSQGADEAPSQPADDPVTPPGGLPGPPPAPPPPQGQPEEPPLLGEPVPPANP